MYCKCCGKEIIDDAKFCYYCGTCVKPEELPELEKSKKNTVAYVGLVISLLMLTIGFILNIVIYKYVVIVGELIMFWSALMILSIIGLICSSVGYKRSANRGAVNIARTGLVIGIIVVLLTAIFLAVDLISLYIVSYVPTKG